MSATTVLLYVLLFCRVAIGLVFLVSFVSKARDVARFRRTITAFRLLPEQLSGVAAVFFLGAELLIVLCLFIGEALLLPGFLLALALLLLFSGAMASVLFRGVLTSCNCFGASEKPVTRSDLWRNVGFILCALSGSIVLTRTQNVAGGLSGLEWLLISVNAGIFVLVWLQLHQIVQFFRGN